VGLPTLSKKKEREASIMNVPIPGTMKVERKRLKTDDAAGLPVFKVTKVRQTFKKTINHVSPLSCF
jgi:hypothetical protein